MILLKKLPWSFLLDKNQTRELTNSLKLILIGVFFWIIKVRYITFFFLPRFHFLNIFGFEIVGTILIFAGIIIIYRVYPFVYSSFAIILNIIILIINILDFFLFRFKLFRELQQYTPFIMSIMLILIAKLLENGTRYFGSQELAEEWKHLGIIIFFGFSIPFYTYVSLNVCGFIGYDVFVFRPKILVLFLPLILALFFFFFYYLHALVMTFKFLNKIQRAH